MSNYLNQFDNIKQNLNYDMFQQTIKQFERCQSQLNVREVIQPQSNKYTPIRKLCLDQKTNSSLPSFTTDKEKLGMTCNVKTTIIKTQNKDLLKIKKSKEMIRCWSRERIAQSEIILSIKRSSGKYESLNNLPYSLVNSLIKKPQTHCQSQSSLIDQSPNCIKNYNPNYFLKNNKMDIISQNVMNSFRNLNKNIKMYNDDKNESEMTFG